MRNTKFIVYILKMQKNNQMAGKLQMSKLLNSHLVHLMPCPFTGHKMFCAGPNFLCRTKLNCASHKHFVRDQKMICIGFCAGTKFFVEALNAVKFLG